MAATATARPGRGDVLAQLVDMADGPESGEMPIRPWRQVELPALMRLYADRCQRGYGFIERSEGLLALADQPQGVRSDLSWRFTARTEWSWTTTTSPIVGYAFTRDDEIVELVCRRSIRSPGRGCWPAPVARRWSGTRTASASMHRRTIRCTGCFSKPAARRSARKRGKAKC